MYEEKRKKKKQKNAPNRWTGQGVLLAVLLSILLVFSIVALALSIYAISIARSTVDTIEIVNGTMKGNSIHEMSAYTSHSSSIGIVKKHHWHSTNITHETNHMDELGSGIYLKSAKQVNHPLGYELKSLLLYEDETGRKRIATRYIDQETKQTRRPTNEKQENQIKVPPRGSCSPDYTPGVKMKHAFDWMFDESNIDGLSLQFVMSNILRGQRLWQQYTPEPLYGNHLPWSGDGP